MGHQPILAHLIHHWSQYGHRHFVLCLGYNANVLKDFFLNSKRWTNSDLVVSNRDEPERRGEQPPDGKVTLIDTGIWRNIGQRLLATRHLVENEEIFLPTNTRAFGGAMDTLRDQQVLEEMDGRGEMPSRLHSAEPNL